MMKRSSSISIVFCRTGHIMHSPPCSVHNIRIFTCTRIISEYDGIAIVAGNKKLAINESKTNKFHHTGVVTAKHIKTKRLAKRIEFISLPNTSYQILYSSLPSSTSSQWLASSTTSSYWLASSTTSSHWLASSTIPKM